MIGIHVLMRLTFAGRRNYKNVRQTPIPKSEFVWMALNMQFGKVKKVKSTKGHTTLPIGPHGSDCF